MTTSHNHAPVAQAELTDSEKNLFTIGKLKEWRDRQHDTLSQLRANAGSQLDDSYVAEFNSTTDDQLDTFLIENGVGPDSPNHDEVRQLYREAAIDTINENDWGNSPASQGIDPSDTKAEEDKFAERIQQRIGNGDQTDPDIPTNDELEALHAEALVENARFDVGTAREMWATESAKRQGKAFSLKDKKRDEIRDDYHKKVQQLGILELEDIIEDTDDDTTKNAKVIAYLFEEQRKLRELTTEKLKGTKVGKFVEFMNKGSLGMRLLKGVGLGVAVGVGGGALLGAAGAAGAAVAAIGASRFVKGYASNDRHRGMKTAEEEFGDRPVELEDTENDSIEQRFNEAAEVYNEAFEDDTKKEQAKRRKALAWGAGSVAVGATLGYAISNFDDVKANISGIDDKISDWWNDTPADVTPDDIDGDLPPAPDLDNDGVIDSEDPDKDNDGVLNKYDSAPNNPNVWETPADKMDWSDFARDARVVEAGEGWYQTFEEMGIPQDHWSDVLESAGPELQDQGWAYFDQSADEWRISQPGKLPPSALETIAEASRRDGFNLTAS
jgi:hypothetical protein